MAGQQWLAYHVAVEDVNEVRKYFGLVFSRFYLTFERTPSR